MASVQEVVCGGLVALLEDEPVHSSAPTKLRTGKTI